MPRLCPRVSARGSLPAGASASVTSSLNIPLQPRHSLQPR